MANNWEMKGDYFKACSCAPGCPCDFWAPPTYTLCEGVIALKIDRGHFEKVSLDGLSWAVAFHWPGPLHLGNGTLQPYVDQQANDEQRNALLTILSGKAGGAWFEVVASLTSKVLQPKFVPIKLEFDLNRRKGRLVVANEVEVIAEPITDIQGNECQTRIEMPKGIEYFSAEVAKAKLLKSTGPIRFNRADVHSSFSAVDHTPAGLRS